MIKKTIIILTLCFSVLGYGQNDSISADDAQKMEKAMSSMFGSEISMEIDEDIYSASQGNAYFTADQKAAIIAMVVPSSYEKMKKDMDNQETKEGLEFLDKGELVDEEGKKLLFMKNSIERGGEVFIMFIYCKENDKDSSITITSYFEKGKEKIYSDLIKKAAFSAQVK